MAKAAQVALPMEETGLTCPSTQANLNVYFQTITPAIAKRLLESNHANNRKIKPKVVQSYARQMAKGLWKSDNGESISISDCGKLTNGQHRLEAVIVYNKPVDFMIISGVPESSITSIDDGVKRNLTDAMTINGKTLPNQSAINGALTCLSTLHGCTLEDLHYESVHGARRQSTSEMVAFFDQLPRFRHVAHDFFTKFKTTKVAKTMPIGISLAMYYLFHDIDEEIVYSIFKSYETTVPMDNLRDLSPTFYAISKSRRHRELRVRIRPYEHITMFIWVFGKMLEHKKVIKAPTLAWNWNAENLIVLKARQKLKRLAG